MLASLVPSRIFHPQHCCMAQMTENLLPIQDVKNRRNPRLVPYTLLDDRTKKSNKDSLREAVRTLLGYGYHLEAPDQDHGTGFALSPLVAESCSRLSKLKDHTERRARMPVLFLVSTQGWWSRWFFFPRWRISCLSVGSSGLCIISAGLTFPCSRLLLLCLAFLYFMCNLSVYSLILTKWH